VFSEGETIGRIGEIQGFTTWWRWHDSWEQAGPIIERERISIEIAGSGWMAVVNDTFSSITYPRSSIGITPLIAAMRAFVKSKFGDTVEV
jgi:hypothetical protein